MLRRVVHLVLLYMILSQLLFADNHDDFNSELRQKIKQVLLPRVQDWIFEEVVFNSIIKQNDKNSALTNDAILALDKKWRAETDHNNKPLVNSILNNKLSLYLKQIQEESRGLYTEIFVMDNKGLNVGQSEITSDYWQGDEAKWKKTFLLGPNAVFIDEVEFDESTQSFQVQLSMAIAKDAKVIGAVTIGIDAEELEQLED